VNRWQVVEVVGVALIAVALGFLHVGIAVGWCGVYLLVTGVMQQMVRGGSNGEG